jgi:hypothetical protein
MGGTNPDTPTSTVDDYPGQVGGTRLVGIDSAGAPIYFDENEDVAYDGYEGDDGWAVGEERESGKLAEVVSSIGDLTGWDALSEYGEENRES